MANEEQLTDVVDEIVTAVRERDGDRILVAVPRLPEAAATAQPAELQRALTELAPAMAEVPLWIGGGLALYIGTLAHAAPDPSVILPTLAGRATTALETAGRFVEIWTTSYGDLPEASDESHVDAVLEKVFQVAPDEAQELVAAWFSVARWLHPVLYLAQRKDVRQTLPGRDRLLAAAHAREADTENAGFLAGLLSVLDDEPLVVLHRPTGRGFRLMISGVGDNFQLHTLLAAALIGEGSEGGLPGVPPAPEMVAAAAGTGTADPEAASADGVTEGQFVMLDAYGKRVWNEGLPVGIERFQGARLLVLDTLGEPQSWESGRAYPMMAPEVKVARPLRPEEAADLLAAVAPGPE